MIKEQRCEGPVAKGAWLVKILTSQASGLPLKVLAEAAGRVGVLRAGQEFFG